MARLGLTAKEESMGFAAAGVGGKERGQAGPRALILKVGVGFSWDGNHWEGQVWEGRNANSGVDIPSRVLDM